MKSSSMLLAVMDQLDPKSGRSETGNLATDGDRAMDALAGDLNSDGRDELLYAARTLQILETDADLMPNQIGGHSLGARPGNSSRRFLALADLDADNDLGNGSSAWKPEIVVQDRWAVPLIWWEGGYCIPSVRNQLNVAGRMGAGPEHASDQAGSACIQLRARTGDHPFLPGRRALPRRSDVFFAGHPSNRA